MVLAAALGGPSLPGGETGTPLLPQTQLTKADWDAAMAKYKAAMVGIDHFGPAAQQALNELNTFRTAYHAQLAATPAGQQEAAINSAAEARNAVTGATKQRHFFSAGRSGRCRNRAAMGAG